MKNLTLPISFEEVPYFRNSFRGDLIITQGIIYYFPHTNILDSSEKKSWLHLPDVLGLVGVPLAFIYEAAWMMVRTTINRSRLRKMGLWIEGDSNQLLQARLDSNIEETKKQSRDLVRYDHTLPRPMRFARTEIKNLSTRRGLRFDTEFDQHDFRIALHRRRLLREALWLGGFMNQENRI